MTTYKKKWVPWENAFPKFTREDTYPTLNSLDNIPLVVLDTETTGLKKTSEITEISIVDYETEKVLLNTFVKPKSIDDSFDYTKASEVSAIKYTHLKDAPAFEDLFPKIQRILQANVIAGWNVSYDAKMLIRSAFPYGLQVPQFDIIDIMALFQHFIGFSDYHTLSEALQIFGYEIPNDAHRSLADVRSTIKILRHMEKLAKERR